MAEKITLGNGVTKKMACLEVMSVMGHQKFKNACNG